LQAGADAPEHARIVERLQSALRDPAGTRPARRATPRHLRHFKVPVRLEFDMLESGERTRLSLVCTDRPGLLADIAQVLRRHRIRVHDARIATFGERVEDFFLLSDENDRAVQDTELLAALRTDMVACVEGETGNGKTENRP
jgi:[protein-PII] uridylyltransferase